MIINKLRTLNLFRQVNPGMDAKLGAEFVHGHAIPEETGLNPNPLQKPVIK
jgi:hypothetical protein